MQPEWYCPVTPTRRTSEGEEEASPRRNAWLRPGERAGWLARPGQRRNRVETAIRLHHRPSGLVSPGACPCGFLHPVLCLRLVVIV